MAIIHSSETAVSETAVSTMRRYINNRIKSLFLYIKLFNTDSPRASQKHTVSFLYYGYNYYICNKMYLYYGDNRNDESFCRG